MLMRYHLGLGVGHKYAHGNSLGPVYESREDDSDSITMEHPEATPTGPASSHSAESDSQKSSSDNTTDYELDGSDEEDDEGDEEDDDRSDDDAMYEM